jgi:hypothetical protein
MRYFRKTSGFGAGSSFGVPHDASHAVTASCEMNSQVFASSRASSIARRCHALRSMYSESASVTRKVFDRLVAFDSEPRVRLMLDGIRHDRTVVAINVE